jgi:hypothetical protein
MLKTTTYKSPSIVFTLKRKFEEATMNTDETKKPDRSLFIAKYWKILKEFGILGL